MRSTKGRSLSPWSQLSPSQTHRLSPIDLPPRPPVLPSACLEGSPVLTAEETLFEENKKEPQYTLSPTVLCWRLHTLSHPGTILALQTGVGVSRCATCLFSRGEGSGWKVPGGSA